MSENTPNNAPQQGPGQGPAKDSGDLVNELREMGQQLETAFRAAIESERAKQLQRDIASGFREISSQVQEAVKTIQANPRVQQAEERGKQVVSQARESKVVQEIQETIVSGIAQLNDQLRKLVERIETEANAPSKSSAAQNVPVEHEPPATGETTRLDDQDQTKL
jgi:heparin binding hemagglutinin HbhA